jgi:hypothetical protein
MLTKFCAYAATTSLCVSVFLFGLSLRENRRVQANVLTTPEPIDLGIVDQGKTIPFKFQVANRSGATIEVVDLKASCGCTWLSDVKGSSIAPRTSLSIGGTLDSKGRRGRMASHAVLKYRDSPSGPTLDMILTVEATVNPTLRIVPESIVIDLVSGSREKIVREVSIDSDRVDLFSISGAQSSVSWITAEIVESLCRKGSSGKNSARLRITIDQAGISPEHWMTASLEKSVEVQTSAEAEPSFTIPILVRKP